MNENKPVYKIKESNDADPKMSVIEKSNFSIDINLFDTVRARDLNQKTIDSIESEVRLKKALISNITANHPEVAALSEETLIGAHMFHEASRYIKIAEEKLAEFAKAQEELKAEIQAIKEQTGIEETKTEAVQEVVNKIINEEKN